MNNKVLLGTGDACICEDCIDLYHDILNIEQDEEVKVFDGLTLVGVKKAACVKRNPLTGADVQVPEKIAPKAKFGKAIKDAINA